MTGKIKATIATAKMEITTTLKATSNNNKNSRNDTKYNNDKNNSNTENYHYITHNL